MKNVKPGHTAPIVCVDAGHYGKYNRSPVVPAYYESVMNWTLHNYLKKELEAHGIEVKQTRANQAKDLSLSARGKASKECDLFLSIHSNACGTESVDRPVVIVQLDGKGDKLGSALAARIKEVMQTRDPYKVATRKGVNGEYYGVLRSAAKVGTVGMILEHSFHTNTRAANWLLVDANLRKLAKAEAKVIAEYFGMEAAQEPEKVTQVTNRLDFAKDFHKSKAGVYWVNSSDGVLNLRAGAGVDKPLIEAMPSGSLVMCYGYHTGDWLSVVSETGNVGFCHGGYLTRKPNSSECADTIVDGR